MSQPSVDGEALSDPDPHSEVMGPEVALGQRILLLLKKHCISCRHVRQAPSCCGDGGNLAPRRIEELPRKKVPAKVRKGPLSESEAEEEVDEEGGGVLLEGSGGQGDGGGRAGFLDPYFGEKGIPKQLANYCTWSLCFDHVAVRPPVRSGDEPYGKRSVSEKMRVKVDVGNDMALWFFSLVEVALQAGLAIWFENAAASWMFKLPEWQKIESAGLR